MIRKLKQKMVAIMATAICMIFVYANPYIAEEISISGSVEQLDRADEVTLVQYFQNRAENFYGNTVESGWIKEDQLERIAALNQWMESCGFQVKNADVRFEISSAVENNDEIVVWGSEWNTLTYKFNSEDESRNMVFETLHVLHLSEITHEIVSDSYSEYTGYQHGNQEELLDVQIGETIENTMFPILGLNWGMQPPEFNGMRISALTVQDTCKIYENEMNVTLLFSEDGLWCIEGIYELSEKDVATEIQNSGMYEDGQLTETADYKLWVFENRKEILDGEKTLSEITRIEVYEYLEGTGQFTMMLERIPVDDSQLKNE